MSEAQRPSVFVETNFLLELAFEQEQARACEGLLDLAERGAITLHLPVVCLLEAHKSLRDRYREWRRMRDQIKNDIFREGARMASLRERAASVRAGVDEMVDEYLAEAARRLDAFAAKAEAVCDILPMEPATVAQANRHREELGLALFDAVVLATVVESLRATRRDALFITRNSRDFEDPQIRAQLRALSCKLFTSFDSALKHIEHQ